MKFRLCLLLALITSPVLAQEPGAFDFRHESVKKILRDSAASQSASALAPAEAEKAPEPVREVRYVPPVKPAPLRQAEVPRLKPAPPAAASNGLLDAVFAILVDEAFDSLLGDDDVYPGVSVTALDRWDRCEGREALKSGPMGYDTCPAKNPGQPTFNTSSAPLMLQD
jgi:hypothetical protein